MKNKIIKYALIAVASVGLTACQEYLDVNQNLNNPAQSQVTPETIFSASQTSLATTQGITMNQLGNIFMGNWSANGIDFADPFGNEFRYNITNNFYSGIWGSLYQNSKNFTFIEEFEDGENWDRYKAAAKILKAHYFQYIVDLYGDSPYSEIHKGEELLFPKYEDDKQTYRKLVDLIDEAKLIIKNLDASSTNNLTSADVMFTGNMVLWERLANTIKLRLLVRQIPLAKTDTEVNTYITREFDELKAENAQFISDDAMINPGYVNLQGKQNPFFSAYGFDVTGTQRGALNQVVPSKYAEDFFKGTLPGTVVDPRGNRLWKKRDPNGTPCQETGVDISGVQPGQNSRGSNIGTGVMCGSDQSLPFMLASESFFLQAEAIEEGYLLGNAQLAFENGIKKSFLHLDKSKNVDPMVTDAASTAYIAASNSLPNLGWNGGNRTAAIANQKWVALTSTNGIELWIEYNRTGFPNTIPLPPQAVTPTGDRPVRLMYPLSEYNGNTNNVITQTTDDAFTSKIFWDN